MAVLYIYMKGTKMTPICTPINGIIYKITNIINGMWYIGKDERDDPKYLGSGVYLSRAIANYGKDNFTKDILDGALTSEKLALLEAEYIEKFNATTSQMSYNIAAGGYGGNTLGGMDNTDKIKFSEKMSETWDNLTIEAKRDRISPMNTAVKGKPKTRRHRDKISKSKTGTKQSIETIEKKRLISKKLYDEGRISPPKNDWAGRIHSTESKIKISKAKTGIKNYKKRLFTQEDCTEMKKLKDSGISTRIIAKIFSTTTPTILRYIRELS